MTTLLAISSTPRRGGNSEAALHSFCRAAEENNISVEIVRLQELRLEPCRGCERCEADGICIIKDRMVPLYQKVAAVDGLVLATPIYFGSLAAQLKIFMDRFQCWWQAKYRLHKPFIPADGQRPAFLITVGAREDKECFESIKAVTRTFFLIINYRLTGSLYFGGFDRRGSVKEEQWALQKAYRAGQSFAREMIVGGGS